MATDAGSPPRPASFKKRSMSTGFNPKDGMWWIASSYAHDEARDRGYEIGSEECRRYVRERMPEIYKSLGNKTYHYEKIYRSEF